MRIAHRSLLAVGTSLLAVFALTACGGSSSSSSSTSAPSSEAASASAAASEAPPSDAASVEASVAASAEASASAAEMPDLCAAVPADQIASIIGSDPGIGAGGGGVCLYDDVQLTLGVAPAEEYDAALESAKADEKVDTVEDITGLGDRAVYIVQSDAVNAVLASQGDFVAVVQGPFSEDQLSSLIAAIYGALG